jgi:hypothetical protein
MQKFILNMFLLTSWCYYSGAVIIESPWAGYIFDKQQPTLALCEIIKVTGIEDKMSAAQECNNLIETFVKITQEEWLRKPGLERDEMMPLHEEKEQTLMPLFDKLGMSSTIYPKEQEYTYGLVLGSKLETAIMRFKFLEDECSKGLKIHKLILLTGKRLLTSEEREQLKELISPEHEISTETEMMVALLTKTDTAPTLKLLNVTVIDTPAKTLSTGIQDSRPRTNGTIQDWLEFYHPEPGSCLAVSTNPFIAYQDTALRTLLNQAFTLETVGPVDPRVKTNPTKIALHLDALGRWGFQEQERQKLIQAIS